MLSSVEVLSMLVCWFLVFLFLHSILETTYIFDSPAVNELGLGLGLAI